MSQCHDLSDYDQDAYPVPEPCPPPTPEVGCHDEYDRDSYEGDVDDAPAQVRDERRAESTSAARSGTTRLRRAGRS